MGELRTKRSATKFPHTPLQGLANPCRVDLVTTGWGHCREFGLPGDAGFARILRSKCREQCCGSNKVFAVGATDHVEPLLVYGLRVNSSSHGTANGRDRI